ncbi:MAG TPA: hydantoinase/oxoprolinase N-terminal domain-containing protein, partial [Acetobacteraceae bacterium]
MAWRVGVDSGGTFTDVCLFEEGSGAIEVWKVSVHPILNCDNLAFSACWHQEMIMAARGFQHLTLDERRVLFRMQEARLGVT